MTFVIVGMPGSGKDVLVRMAKELGFDHTRMGDVVRDWVKNAGIAPDDVSVGGYATEERRIHGKEVWAVRTLERIPSGNVIIDGSRSLAEIDHFKKGCEDVEVIAVEAPDELRFRRLKGRGREDDPESRDDFRTRDEREESWGIREAIASATVTIINNKSLEEFEGLCRMILGDFIAQNRKSI